MVLVILHKTMNNGRINKDKSNKQTKTTNKRINRNSKRLMIGTAIFIAAILVVSGTNIKAFADNVVDDVEVTSTHNTFTAPGSTSVQYKINANGGDDQSGCNANDGSTATVTLSVPSEVTASTTSLTFNACNSFQSVTFSSSTPGDYAINVAQISDTGVGSYKNEANFVLHVLGPAGTVPKFTNPGATLATEEATSAAGAVVTYTTPTATGTPTPTVTCTPASPSQFQIGSNPVSCKAENSIGSITETFYVLVQDTTPPTLNLPSSITEEATSSSGAPVTYTATASDAVSGNVPVTCDYASGATFPLGTTTVKCSATDGAGLKAEDSFIVTVRDTTPPDLDIPSGIQAIATTSSGAVVTFTKSALDLVSGSVLVTCTPDSGATFPLRTTTVNCEAKDAAGNIATGSFAVSVTFPPWSGILQPINKEGDSIFKLGSTVPVKFQIPIPGGGYITDADAKLLVAKVSNGVIGDEVEATTTTPASSGNLFRFDGTQYIYNLGTKSGYTAGTWQLRIDIGDGSINTVLISLRK
jgi:hypothetical protein